MGRRNGLVQILRPGQPRYFDGQSQPSHRRQGNLETNQAIPKRRHHGRRAGKSKTGRRTSGIAAQSATVKHYADGFGSGIGNKRTQPCPLRGRLQYLCEIRESGSASSDKYH